MTTTPKRKQKPPADEQQEASLRITIEEQRRTYDYHIHMDNRIHSAEILLLTGSFAVLIYLYGSSPQSGDLLEHFVFAPLDKPCLLGLYGAAVTVFLLSLILLSARVFGGKRPWLPTYPIDHRTAVYEPTAIDTLKYYSERYIKCHANNRKRARERRRQLRTLFLCILYSSFVLIVMKALLPLY